MLPLKPDMQTKSLSVFIPAPPPRKTPYRERVLDKIISKLSKSSAEIINIEMQSISGETQGMWILLIYKVKKDLAENLETDLDKVLDSTFNDNEVEKIEGLYFDDNP